MLVYMKIQSSQNVQLQTWQAVFRSINQSEILLFERILSILQRIANRLETNQPIKTIATYVYVTSEITFFIFGKVTFFINKVKYGYNFEGEDIAFYRIVFKQGELCSFKTCICPCVMISSKLNLMNDEVDVNLTYIITNNIVSSFPRVTLIIYCLFLQIINNQELSHASSKYLFIFKR